MTTGETAHKAPVQLLVKLALTHVLLQNVWQSNRRFDSRLPCAPLAGLHLLYSQRVEREKVGERSAW